MTKKRNKLGCGSSVLLAGFFMLGSISVRAAESPVALWPKPSQTIPLEYREVDFTVMHCSVPLSVQTSRFPREPELGKSKVLRGTFDFHGLSNEMAFVWDKSIHQLYLDLNRNRDLTDDATGVFRTRERDTLSHGSYSSATVTNIPLTFKGEGAERKCRVDLHLWESGNYRNCSAMVRSYWQGKMVLDNEDWQVGVVESWQTSRKSSFANAHLLFRPWAARDRSFITEVGPGETFPFAQQVFVQNHAFQVSFTNELREGRSAFQLQFTEQHPRLGELKITGSQVQCLALEGSAYFVRLDKPAGVVKVPVGDYRQSKVWLKSSNHEAHSENVTRRLTIAEKKTAELAVGGPLTNSVAAIRHGRSLKLDYKLIGAGGDVYQLVQQNRAQPPTFAIFKGDKQLASGKFEFG